MEDKQLRLEAIRLAKGDISKAEGIVNYVEQGWLEDSATLDNVAAIENLRTAVPYSA